MPTGPESWLAMLTRDHARRLPTRAVVVALKLSQELTEARGVINQAAFGQRVNLSRRTVARALGDLKRARLIEAAASSKPAGIRITLRTP